VRLTFEPAVEPAELKAHLSVFAEARGKRAPTPYSLLSLDKQRNEYVEIQGNERVHDVILLPDDHQLYVRAMLRGESITPPTAAKETRNPEVFGRTGRKRWFVEGQ
jgi:hypothetical protein